MVSSDCHHGCGRLPLMSVLTINAGSSSIRFAFYGAGSGAAKLEYGKIERIGQPGAAFEVSAGKGKDAQRIALDAGSFRSAVDSLVRWLESQPQFADVSAVGHRVVHGMTHSQPARVTPQLLGELKAAVALRPRALCRRRSSSSRPSAGAFRGSSRWRASTRPSTAPCRESRRCCRFRAATKRRACGATASTAFRTLSCCKSSGAWAIPPPSAAASSSRTWATARASPQCATGAASIPAWPSHRPPDCR